MLCFGQIFVGLCERECVVYGAVLCGLMPVSACCEWDN